MLARDQVREIARRHQETDLLAAVRDIDADHVAALVERRLVTSIELTNMYLSRLKKYQPLLNFYVTLTEDLALKQAADADRAKIGRDNAKKLFKL